APARSSARNRRRRKTFLPASKSRACRPCPSTSGVKAPCCCAGSRSCAPRSPRSTNVSRPSKSVSRLHVSLICRHAIIATMARRRVSLVATFLAALFVSVAAGPTGVPRPTKFDYTMFTLPNGLQTVLLEDHSTPIVHLAVWYHVGSKDEKPGRTGFAHLFEH